MSTQQKKQIDNVQEWADEMIEVSKGLLARDGMIEPFLLFLFPSPNDPTQIVPGVVPLREYMEDVASKDLLATLLSEVLRKSKAVASLFITEAWTRKFTTEEAANHRHGDLAKDPERAEVVMTLLETQTSTLARMWAIERDEEGTPRVGELVHSSDGHRPASGRFAAMLQPLPVGLLN
jgi:hypothetical protein